MILNNITSFSEHSLYGGDKNKGIFRENGNVTIVKLLHTFKLKCNNEIVFVVF